MNVILKLWNERTAAKRNALNTACGRYEIKCLQNHDALNYQATEKRLIAEMVGITDAAKLDQLRTESQKYQGNAAEQIARNLRLALGSEYHRDVVPLVLEYLDDAIAAIQTIRVQVVADETALCKKYGVAWRAGPATSECDKWLKTITAQRKMVANPQPTIPGLHIPTAPVVAEFSD